MPRITTYLLVISLALPTAASAQEPARPAAKPATGAASKGERERRAQAAFIAGRYEDAASLLHGLYIEFNNPVYLRNLGRSYQRLKDPEKAITAFEEYLRSSRNLTADEQKEIRGFIKEMEDLRRQKEAAAAPPPPPPPPPPVVAPVTAPPTGPAPPPDPGPPPIMAYPPPQQVETRPPEASGGGSGKLIGGILLGAAALLAGGGGYLMAAAWSENDTAKKHGCPGASGCDKYADRVDSNALVSKILFGAAAAAGVAGGVVLVLSLSSDSPRAGHGMTIALEGKF